MVQYLGGAVASVLQGVSSIISKLSIDLDAKVSTRQASWGATTAHRDRIDASISSRQPDAGLTSIHASRLDTNVSSRASQSTTNLLVTKVEGLEALRIVAKPTVKLVDLGAIYQSVQLSGFLYSEPASGKAVELIAVTTNQTTGFNAQATLTIFENDVKTYSLTKNGPINTMVFNEIRGMKLGPYSSVQIHITPNYPGGGNMVIKFLYRDISWY